jgi:hypothetical protein
MRIRKIALGLATAFVLAAPVSGVAFTAPSVVEAATIDMLTTRVTPESSIDVEVVFTLTDDSKVAFANDLDTILSLTLTGSKNVVINGTVRVATVQDGVVYLDDETLVNYVTKTTNTTFTINWPAGLREETVKLFGDFGALARDYACDINVAGTHFDAFQAADGVTSVQINGTTRVNYTVSDGSIVFDGDVSSLFADLKDKNKVQVTVESLFKNPDGIQKASDGKWYLAKDGVRNSSFTGFAQYDKNGRWFYVENGVLPMDENGNFSTKGIIKGTVDGETAEWFVSSGRVQTEFTGLYHSSKGWKMIVNGKVDNNYTGFAYAAEKKGWYMVRKGKIDFTINGVSTPNGTKGTVNGTTGYWFTSNGKVLTDTTKLVKFSTGVWRAVVNGRVMLKNDNWTGIIAKASGKKYYVKGSVLQSKYSGTVTIDGVTYKIVRGVVVSESK